MCGQHCDRPPDVYDTEWRTMFPAPEMISRWLLLKKTKKSLFEPLFRALRHITYSSRAWYHISMTRKYSRLSQVRVYHEESKACFRRTLQHQARKHFQRILQLSRSRWCHVSNVRDCRNLPWRLRDWVTRRRRGVLWGRQGGSTCAREVLRPDWDDLGHRTERSSKKTSHTSYNRTVISWAAKLSWLEMRTHAHLFGWSEFHQ